MRSFFFFFYLEFSAFCSFFFFFTLKECFFFFNFDGKYARIASCESVARKEEILSGFQRKSDYSLTISACLFNIKSVTNVMWINGWNENITSI